MEAQAYTLRRSRGAAARRCILRLRMPAFVSSASYFSFCSSMCANFVCICESTCALSLSAGAAFGADAAATTFDITDEADRRGEREHECDE